MVNPSSEPNPEAKLLPEVDSLPDGFVESSSADGSDEPVNDYKEEKLLDPDQRPEVVIGDCGSPSSIFEASVDNGSESEAVKVVAEAHKEEHVKEKCVESMGPESVSSSRGLQTVASEHVSVGQSAESHKKETSEVKRKSSKRAFKSEKELLEFTLKYQQVIAERDSALAVREKLESLCRELQRQNKLLMDECKRVSSEGQNLRFDLSNKFQDAIKELSNKLDEQKDESISQLKENEMLKIKLKQLLDQYSLSEQEHVQQLKQKTLELQLADLKLKQHEEKLKQEQLQMKLYADQVAQLLATEKNLRLQVTADSEKFQQFQEALMKSNEVFETFKQEIDKMATSVKELKKENTFLKSKCEKTDVTLIQLADERERLKKQLEKTRNQKEKLESLCRSLAAERETSSLKSSNSDSIPSGCCKPPTSCSYGAGVAAGTQDVDCSRWNNASSLLCYECDSCKACVLNNVRRDWHKLSVLNIVMVVVLIGVYTAGCCTFRNAQRAETDYSYGVNRMSKDIRLYCV